MGFGARLLTNLCTCFGYCKLLPVNINTTDGLYTCISYMLYMAYALFLIILLLSWYRQSQGSLRPRTMMSSICQTCSSLFQGGNKSVQTRLHLGQNVSHIVKVRTPSTGSVTAPPHQPAYHADRRLSNASGLHRIQPTTVPQREQSHILAATRNTVDHRIPHLSAQAGGDNTVLLTCYYDGKSPIVQAREYQQNPKELSRGKIYTQSRLVMPDARPGAHQQVKSKSPSKSDVKQHHPKQRYKTQDGGEVHTKNPTQEAPKKYSRNSGCERAGCTGKCCPCCPLKDVRNRKYRA